MKEMSEEERAHKRAMGRKHYWKHREEILAKLQVKRDAAKEEKLREEKERRRIAWEQRKAKMRRRSPEETKIVKSVRQQFFLDFSEWHCEWLRELVAKYKERGVYPVYPTQIADYYPDKNDKEIAILSALCMSWDNGKEIEQMASMRKLMGEHPYQWFRDREFVTISIGREQDNAIEGYVQGKFWKIAKLYDMLYDVCDGKLPSEVFKKVHSFKDFCENYASSCNVKDMEYKRNITEHVLRVSDGIGRSLWPTIPSRQKSPNTGLLRKYMRMWFPDYHKNLWTWDEAVALFRLDKPYDFFYACLAYDELSRVNPEGCRKYANRYHYRWKNQLIYPRSYWLGYMRFTPEICFELKNLI